MPNHCYNSLSIYGDKETIEKMKSSLFTFIYEYGEIKPKFDFNKLIEKPKIFDIHLIIKGWYPGLESKDGYMEITTHDNNPFLHTHHKTTNQVKTDDYVYTEFDIVTGKDEREIIIGSGKEYNFPIPEILKKALFDCYGSTNWYEWSYNNWGTKWNAYDQNIIFNDDCIELFFVTAWSPPQPIYDKLIELFPEISIEGVIHEESGEFAYNINYNKTEGWIESDLTPEQHKEIYPHEDDEDEPLSNNLSEMQKEN